MCKMMFVGKNDALKLKTIPCAGLVFAVSVRALLSDWKWRHVSMIYDEHEVFYQRMAPAMISDFLGDDDFPALHPVKFNRSQPWDPTDLLIDASAHARGRCIYNIEHLS